MARRKALRNAEKSDRPPAPAGGPPPERLPDRPSPARRDFLLTLLVLLAGAGTAFIWMETPVAEHAALNDPASLQPGLLLTAVLWIVALAGLLGRLQARRTVRDLHAILTREETVNARLEPGITEDQSGLRMRYVSAWLVAILGVAAAAVLSQTDAIERAVGQKSTFVVGATLSVALALAVAANALNRRKARRLARDFRAALASERLALDTLGALNVMTSACLPTGERTRFNEHFLRFVGRTEAKMQGKTWLEAVHTQDCQKVLEIVAKPLSDPPRSREHDFCIRHRDGRFVWVRETLTPRLDDKGNLIEFIATAVDITPHMETVASLDKQMGDLKADLAKATSELEEVKGEHSKAKTSRNRFETGLEEAREEVKNLQHALSKAEEALEKMKIEAPERIKEAQAEARDRVRTVEQEAEARVRKTEEGSETRVSKAEEAARIARQEVQQVAAENKKLTRACETLQSEMAALRHQGGDVRELSARHLKEIREAREKTADAQASEAQHRARNLSLAQRCSELEAQLAAKDAAVAAARDRAERVGAAAAAEAQRRVSETSAEALATQLRKQLGGMQRMTGELLAQGLDGPAKDAAHNTAATVRSMTELVDHALGGGAAPAAGPGAGASFDLGRTAQGVRDLLAPDAQARGVKLEVEVAKNVGAAHGDETQVRAAIMSLAEAALHLVQDGTLVLRLKEDVNTAAHTTIRCELNHATARVKNDAVEAALALKATDASMPDAVKQPVQHQAAKAWRTIRALEGQHGFVMPAEGGFSVWFTFTLGRPGASALLRPESAPSAAPLPGPAASADSSDAGGSRPLPRMPQEYLNCSLGEVVELGADGMRVYCAKAPKDKEITVTIEDADLDREIRAEVTWSKKISGRKHDVGLKFLGLTTSEQQRILRTAMQHRKVAVMSPQAG